MKKPVLTKKDFVRRYQLGEFGNSAPTWDSWMHFAKDPKGLELWKRKGQLWHIRNRIKGGATWYNVKPDHLNSTWLRACKEVGEGNLYLSAMAPTEKTVLQGEVTTGEIGLSLFSSKVKKPMRDSLKEGGIQSYNLEAKHLLMVYLDANSYGWLETLLRDYPDHVIEFSAYSTNWGTLPYLNTVIWEVRKY